jgi:hypothetical protein
MAVNMRTKDNDVLVSDLHAVPEHGRARFGQECNAGPNALNMRCTGQILPAALHVYMIQSYEDGACIEASSPGDRQVYIVWTKRSNILLRVAGTSDRD